jgi:RsfA family transcription factor
VQKLLPRSWTPEEDRLLLQWVNHCRKMGMARIQSFESAGDKLGRSANACYVRWVTLTKRDSEAVSSTADKRKKWRELENEHSAIRERIDQLEDLLRSRQKQVEQLVKENKKLKEEMKFFELMLVEQYRILVNLLNKKDRDVRIHHL